MEVTASEIINELRRAARSFEVYKEALKVAEFFLDLESQEKAIRKSIDDLAAEKTKMDQSINMQVDEANKKLLDLKKKQVVAEESIQEVARRAEEQMASARKDALAIVAAAQNQAKAIQDSTVALRNEENKVRNDLHDLKQAYSQLVNEMHAKREQLLKAFN
jgi:uncharacterized phage infection (PIP) family protein YhgE